MLAKKIKKRQIRRCTVCGKTGHNKTTCTTKVETKQTDKSSTKKAVSKPVKFFIHHVGSDPLLSPHLVNLKKGSSKAWKKVKSYSPENSESSLFHYYHNLEKKSEKKFSKESLMVNLHEFQDNFIEETETKKIPTKLLQKKHTIKTKIDSLPKFSINGNRKKINFHFTNPFKNLKTGIQNQIEQTTNAFKMIAWKKATVSFAVIAMLLILPSQVKTQYSQIKLLTNEVTDSSTEGFMSLQDATLSLMQSDLLNAQSSLTNALKKFNDATETMNNHHKLLQKIVKVVPILNNQVTSRQNLILAGQSISLGNAYLLKGLSEKIEDESNSRIGTTLTHLQLALPHYKKSLKYLEETDTSVLPLEYQSPFNEYRQIFKSLINDLEEISKLANTFQEIFGEQGMRRYLLVFQNEAEIRATGGFVGSFAILDVKNGKIENLTIPAGGSYDLQGQLTEFIEPPAPLLIANKRWEFQDANWFPNFPDSAEKLLWFFRKSRNLTADGVIAINSSVLERLLSLTGPIIDEKRDVKLSSLNAIKTIQTIVETGEEKKQDKPKQILTDLAPSLVDYIENINASETLPLLANLNDALNKKEIQVYFKDDASQNAVSNFGWAGKIIKSKKGQDYLMVVNSNIQGQKSDANIIQEIHHESLVQPDGSIINNVIIKREHVGNNQEHLYGTTNINYLRLYVPEGSELLTAEGFNWPDEKYFRSPEKWYSEDEDLNRLEKLVKMDSNSGTRITKEFGKTSFGNWTITKPGEISEIKFSYRLPFKINLKQITKMDKFWNTFSNTKQTAKYQLIIQRQSGNETGFSSQVIFQDTWSPTWSQGDGLTLAVNGAKIQIPKLEKDQIFSILMQK